MKLELPDNNASVLFHMGNALQSIARDIDTSLPVNGHKGAHTETVGDVSCTIANEPSDTAEDVTNAVRASLEALLGRCRQQTTEDLNTTDSEQYGKSVLSDCLDSIDESAESIGIIRQQASDTTVEVSDTIDADGLPWDQRINSKGRTRIKGDVWRARQKPNDKSDEEWAEYVEGVKAELRALMAIPVATGAELDVLANTPVITPPVADVARIAVNGVVLQPVNEMPLADVDPFEADPFAIDDGISIEDITQAEVDAAVIAPPVDAAVIAPPVDAAVIAPPVDAAVIAPPVDAAVIAPPVDAAVIAPPVDAAVIAPPVDAAVIAPPVVDAEVATGPTTFPELMKFITVNNKKLTKESVDEALKAQGLASIALLAARTDLIPQVHAALVKLL